MTIRDKIKVKDFIKSLVYMLVLLGVALWVYYILKLWMVALFLFLLLFLILSGIVYNLATMKKNQFMIDVDEMTSDEFHSLLIYPFFLKMGFKEIEKNSKEKYVLSFWQSIDGKTIQSVSIIKKDYINDEDFNIDENLVDLYICSNSYYYGSKKRCEIICRKNMWQIYKSLNYNAKEMKTTHKTYLKGENDETV